MVGYMRLDCGGIRKISHEWQNRRLVLETPLKKNCTVEKSAKATIRQISSSIPPFTGVPLKMQLWKYNQFALWAKIPMLYEHFIYDSITDTLNGLSLNRPQCELSQILISFISLLKKINIT